MASQDEGKVRPTTTPTVVSVSSGSVAAAGGKEGDFSRYVRDNHTGHDVQRVGHARVNPGVLGVPQRGKSGTLDIWFCGTDGTIMYDLA